MNEANLTGESLEKIRTETVQFNGQGGEYFKIWIVNLLLSILTLGVYSAWAKVRTNRYFYGNTEIDGSVFEYHATPMMILKGRIIAVIIFALVLFSGRYWPALEPFIFVALALVTPWIIWRSIIFKAKMTSYRNVQFAFMGRVSRLYIYLLVLPFLPILIAGAITGLGWLSTGQVDQIVAASTIGTAIMVTYLMWPYLQKKLTSFYIDHHRFGQGEFKAKLQAGQFYVIYLKLFGLGILLSILVGVVLLIVGLAGGLGFDLQSLEGLSNSGFISGVSISQFGIFLLFIGVALFSKAYLHTRIRNYVFEHSFLSAKIQIQSKMQVGTLFLIYFTNLILLLVTLGLAYPWTIVRLSRYKLETISFRVKGSLDGFVTQMQSRQSAIGEELGEAFDLDIDLGI